MLRGLNNNGSEVERHMNVVSGASVEKSTSDEMIGTSTAIDGIRCEVECAARSDAKVLLTGESGVGKDIAARAIHQRSARSHRPFVTINCVSVPDTLLEPELFGHVKGSFTGAYRDRIGLLEAAHGGTVFLDEVCEMSPRMQALLLRFLESGEIQRVGSDRTQSRIDARVLAATNRDPLELVASKTFREDLYYRLNVIEIRVPPLRARRDDIPLLFDHFLRRCAEAYGMAAPVIAPDTMQALVDFEWPGNIRQLKNVAERLIARGPQRPFITIADLPPEVSGGRRAAAAHLMAARPEHSAIEAVFDRMVLHRESFWSAVYPAFMTRDLTRADLRFIVGRGLQETAGSYKMLVDLLNMKPTDYKRFLNFLRKHECQVPFERYRSVRRRPHATPEDGFRAAHIGDGTAPVLDDVIPLSDDVREIPTARH
jgi:transcriptional regulator with PAS, ATPase and Fis domain